MGHTEHTDLLKKLFKGVQHQVGSVLKFSLKYYGRKSSELDGKQGKSAYIHDTISHSYFFNSHKLLLLTF